MRGAIHGVVDVEAKPLAVHSDDLLAELAQRREQASIHRRGAEEGLADEGLQPGMINPVGGPFVFYGGRIILFTI